MKTKIFKLSVTTINVILLMLIFIPFFYSLIIVFPQSIKYGYTFIAKNFKMVLFISFAPALLIAAFNFIEFEAFRKIDAKFYQKARQKLTLKFKEKVPSIQEENLLKTLLNQKGNWKILSSDENHIKFKRTSRYFITDIIEIKTLDNHRLELSSKPRLKVWFIDFGRNYRNLLSIKKQFELFIA